MADFELEHKLDPTIWSNVHHDILINIIEQSDPSTLTNLSCTSRVIFPIASCEVWGSLRIYSSEITAYIFIVSGRKSKDHGDGIVHFLLESAYRHHHTWKHVFTSNRTRGVFIHRPNGVERYVRPEQLTATLPISRVKELEIDNQGFTDQHPICNQFDMDLVLPTLLKRLLKLQSFTYLGPLSTKNLTAIIQVDSLRVLHVRNSDDVLKAPATAAPTSFVPWKDWPLDWSALANLKGLQVLEVGRLIRCEAFGLAQGIASLNLTRLHLSCWGWEYENVDPRRPIRSGAYTSGLVLFLDALVTHNLRSNQTFPGLPPTLKHLALVDKYHTRIPSLHQLIAAAILPCEDLETLSTTISINGGCYDVISKMGLPAYHKIVGLDSWTQLCCEEGVKILHQYKSPSGEILQTYPYPRRPRNLFETLDRVIASTEGPGNYRMSMKFVKERQARSDAILVYPGEEEHGPSAGERGPQVQDASMMDLATAFQSLSLEDQWWVHVLQCWGIGPGW